ncbi:MAG: substrate-binding domain-containing protein [Pseudopedobacter sp.]|nr:substrate-binding domain-containing protein [Deinococcales bacterium]
MKKSLKLLATLALFSSSALAAPITLGISVPSADHGWTGGVVYWANQAKAQFEKQYPGSKIIIKTAKDTSEQAAQIQDMVASSKIDTLVILPHEGAAMTKPLSEVKKKGVYVVVVDRALSDLSAQDAYVAGDNPGLGKVSAEYVGKQLGGKGNVVVLRGIATPIDNQRVEGFESVMKSKYPNVKILDKKYANWNRDDGYKVMQDFLTRFPKIDAVWAQDDDIAVGVLKAIQQANRKDIKLVLGGAGMKEMIKKVMDGDKLITANVTYPPRMIYQAVELAVKARTAGKMMAKSTILPSQLVTKANAKNFYYPDSPF